MQSFIQMNLALLFRAQKAIRVTPALFSHSGAQNSIAGAFSARSSVLSPSQSKRLLSTVSQSGKAPPAPSAEKVIRATNQYHNRTKWGFVTCRCTYKSQTKWDEFMLRIKDDARKYLKDDPDLFESMDWTVIEDPKLDSVHYVVAARRFGDWVETSLSEEKRTATPRSNANCPDFPEGWRIGLDSRHGGFIYANEDAVNSVVDHPKGEDTYGSGGHFVYLVNYTGVQESEKSYQEIIDMLARRDAGEALPGDDEIAKSMEYVEDLEKEDNNMDDDCQEWRELRVKFRACDLVPGYATVEGEGGWEYGFVSSSHDIYEPGIFDAT